MATNLTCVEYPGVVDNVSHMLDTLGGIESVSEVFLSPNRRLELRFRPEDVFCKPACGERVNESGEGINICIKK